MSSAVTHFKSFVHKFNITTPNTSNINKEKIWEVVKLVFMALLTLGLLAANPGLFLAGLIIGMVAPNKVSEAADKVFVICKNWPIPSAIFIGCVAFVALPQLSGACSLLFAAYMGSELIKKCRNNKSNTNTTTSTATSPSASSNDTINDTSDGTSNVTSDGTSDIAITIPS